MSIQKARQSGFTIVELLIVIVVIGILAALVITTFSGIQQKARDTERQTDIKALHSQLEAFFAQDGGGYPAIEDVNDAAWRAIHMKGLDITALCAPGFTDQTACALGAAVLDPAAQTAATEVYGYTTKTEAGAACNTGAGTVCAKYTLTANLEGSINGSKIYSKDSLN